MRCSEPKGLSRKGLTQLVVEGATSIPRLGASITLILGELTRRGPSYLTLMCIGQIGLHCPRENSPWGIAYMGTKVLLTFELIPSGDVVEIHANKEGAKAKYGDAVL